MTTFCTTCGAPRASDMAMYCIKCGALLPLTTALVPTEPAQQGKANREFLATDLARIEQKWLDDGEELRHHDLGWNIIGRDVYRFLVHRTVKRMHDELMEMDREAATGYHALRRQHSLKQARSRDERLLAEEEIIDAVRIYAVVREEIMHVVNGLNVSDAEREDIAAQLSNEVVIPRLKALVAHVQHGDTELMGEIEKLMAKRIERLLPKEEEQQ